jgi:bifunctional DNA-binding transcriptional regulator/antitoxin component of YhaV-PrlF toxin-antitoxin module
MRISAKGRVTIPAHIRKLAGLVPHTDIEVLFDGTSVQIVRTAETNRFGRGAQIVAHLKGRGDVPMSTDEIIALMRGD